MLFLCVSFFLFVVSILSIGFLSPWVIFSSGDSFFFVTHGWIADGQLMCEYNAIPTRSLLLRRRGVSVRGSLGRVQGVPPRQ